MEATQLDDEERERFGSVVGALIGFEARRREHRPVPRSAPWRLPRSFGMTEEDVKRIADDIPNDTAAAVFLIEHLWAKDLKQALRDANGFLIAQGMVTPEALVARGAALRKAVEAADVEEQKKPMAAPARLKRCRTGSLSFLSRHPVPMHDHG